MGGNGVLVCSGGLYSGNTFYVVYNRPAHEYNTHDRDRFQIRSDIPQPTGKVELKDHTRDHASFSGKLDRLVVKLEEVPQLQGAGGE